MKTPMQEHIEWLNDENKKYIRQAKEESSMQILGYAFKIQDCIKHAESLLQKEKEVIIDAHIDGQCDDTDGTPFEKAERYYNETFKTEE